MLETDAPSIGLEGIDPVAAEPCHVRDVAAAQVSGVERGLTGRFILYSETLAFREMALALADSADPHGAEERPDASDGGAAGDRGRQPDPGLRARPGIAAVVDPGTGAPHAAARFSRASGAPRDGCGFLTGPENLSAQSACLHPARRPPIR